MKPLGPIPPGFAAIDGELAIAGRKASDLAADAGNTPLFVYARELLDRKMAGLRAAMEERGLLFFRELIDPEVVLAARREILLKYAIIGEIDDRQPIGEAIAGWYRGL